MFCKKVLSLFSVTWLECQYAGACASSRLVLEMLDGEYGGNNDDNGDDGAGDNGDNDDS